MTREEAIERLISRKEHYELDANCQELAQALGMAIEALSAEPCEKTQMIDKSNFDPEQYRADLQSAFDCGKASVKCEDAISFPKGTLKKRGKGYVVYNPEWLKENWQTELKVMGVECEDAISRAAAIKAIQDRRLFKHVTKDGWFWLADEKVILYVLNSLPSVTPKPKMGHWMLQPSNKDQGERDFIWWKCSECGQVIFSESERDRREFHAYCSRCGAKMSEIPTGSNCTDCILDGTDACSRGAGRSVDGRVCEDFVGESEDAE